MERHDAWWWRVIYPLSCGDCGCSFVAGSSVAKRCKACAHRSIIEYDRRRRAVAKAKGVVYKRTRKRSPQQNAKRRYVRAFRIALRQLSTINRAIDRLWYSLRNDYRKAMRRACLRANAKRLELDRARRKTKRRRLADPSANRGHKRLASMVFDVFKEYGYQCAYCGVSRTRARATGFDLQLDHIVPLGDPACVHGQLNAAPACISCNASKGKRDLVVWAKRKGLTPHPKAMAKYYALRAKHAA